MIFTTADLLAAAKRGAGIPSNYRLARVLGTNDNTLSRWHSGKVVPDDAYAVRLAELAQLDSGFVIAAMRAAREKDASLRAIWADMAERLLLTAGMPGSHDGGTPPTEGNDPESGPGEGGTSGPKTGALMSMDESHIMRSPAAMTVTRRQARIALARALRALRKARSH